MYTHLEDYIFKLYHSIGIRTTDQLDLFSIATLLKVEIVYRKTIFRFGNEVILKNNSPSEQWMDFGHELGHVLLHSGSQLNMYPLYREYQEWRADLFALHFCVPTFMLEQSKEVTVYEVMEVFSVDYQFAQKRLEMYKRKSLKRGGYIALQKN